MANNRTFEQVIPAGLLLTKMRPKILPKNILTAKGGIYVCDGTNDPIMFRTEINDQILVSSNENPGVGFSNVINGAWLASLPIETLLHSNDQPANQVLLTKNDGSVGWGDFVFNTHMGNMQLSGRKFKELMSDFNSDAIQMVGVTETNNADNNSYFRPQNLSSASISKTCGYDVLQTHLSCDDHCLIITENYLDNNITWSLKEGIKIPTDTSSALITKLFSSYISSELFPGDPTNLSLTASLWIPTSTSSTITAFNITQTFSLIDSYNSGIPISISATHRTAVINAINNSTKCALQVNVFDVASGRNIQQTLTNITLTAAQPPLDASFRSLLDHTTGSINSLTAHTTYVRDNLSYASDDIVIQYASIITTYLEQRYSFELEIPSSMIPGQTIDTETVFDDRHGERPYATLKNLIDQGCSFSLYVSAYVSSTLEDVSVYKDIGTLSYL